MSGSGSTLFGILRASQPAKVVVSLRKDFGNERSSPSARNGRRV